MERRAALVRNGELVRRTNKGWLVMEKDLSRGDSARLSPSVIQIDASSCETWRSDWLAALADGTQPVMLSGGVGHWPVLKWKDLVLFQEQLGHLRTSARFLQTESKPGGDHEEGGQAALGLGIGRENERMRKEHKAKECHGWEHECYWREVSLGEFAAWIQHVEALTAEEADGERYKKAQAKDKGEGKASPVLSSSDNAGVTTQLSEQQPHIGPNGVALPEGADRDQALGTLAAGKKRKRPRHWGYCSYKHFAELLSDSSEGLKEELKIYTPWRELGVPGDRTLLDATLWLGSAGAFTPLHYDTYGSNLILQVKGTKRWLLFAPEDTPFLYPTRVPYEESSVYSQLDPRFPIDSSLFPLFCQAHPPTVIDLKEGDVLFLPRHWWHLAQCRAASLSVNCWWEAKSDDRERVKEAIVRTIVTALKGYEVECTGDEEELDDWINPGEEVYPHKENLSCLRRAVSQARAMQRADEGEETTDSKTKPRKRRKAEPLTTDRLLNAILFPHNVEQVADALIEGRY